MEKAKRITKEDLKQLSEWLKNSKLSDFEKLAKNTDVEKFIQNMIVINPEMIKEPYTL